MSVKISELPILSSLADNDVIAGVDTSANVTSKIEMVTLKNYIDTNTQYTAGTNIDITNNVVSAPNVYNKTETDGLIDNLEANINEQLEEKDEQIEELQSEVDSLSTIFNAFPTESGEGESLTLDDTAEVKFKKFDLKGNTSQFTTTGKNLLPNDTETKTRNGITITKNSDGTYKINGTATDDFSEAICNNFIPMSGTWRMLGCPSGGSDSTYMLSAYVGYWGAGSPNIDIGNGTNITYTGNVKVRFYIKSGTTCNNLIFKPMLTTDTSTTINDFEPYTGGQASPNPDYPQDIHVVSGDNEIEVCGKNLIGLGTILHAYRDNSTGKIQLNDNCVGYYFPTSVLPDTITFSCVGGNRANISYYNSVPASTVESVDYSNSNSLPRTISVNKTYAYIFIQFSYNTLDVTNIQLEKGSTASTYEPYQGNTYPINLGVKNLWNSEDMKSGYLPQSGSYPTTDPSYPNSRYIIVPLMKGQSITTYSEVTYSAFRIRYIDKDTNLIVGTVSVGENNGYCNSNATYQSGFANGTITATKDVLLGLWDFDGYMSTSGYYKITYGTTLQQISPNPIELCKIGNYQDYFGKSDGRNLFDKDNLTIEIGTISATGTFDYSTERLRAYYIEVDENTTYTVSTSNSDLQIVPYFYNSNKTFLSFDNGWKNFPYTFTTPSNTKYIALLFKNSNNTPSVGMIGNLQLEKGSSVSDYQPYGVGKWYLHKEIGKVVLNGSENWGVGVYGTNSYNLAKNDMLYTNNNIVVILSNLFKGIPYNDRTTGNNIIYPDVNESTIYIRNTSYTSLADFKTMLGITNLVSYYVLATPTSEGIPTNLINQLEQLYIAQSKNNQTNISQVSNDKPFILDVTAIKSLQNVLDRIELLES